MNLGMHFSCLAKGGIMEVKIEFYNQTDMFFHHSGSFLSANSRSRVDVNTGQFIKIAITHEVVQLLRGEDFSNCVDYYENDLSYDDCIYSNLYDLMMNQGPKSF